MSDEKKFLKYRARILAINGGNTPDRLTAPITVHEFRGYSEGEVIPAGTLLSEIIQKEFNSAPVTYTITISSTGAGTVSPTGTQTVYKGASLTITATPDAGSQLKSFKVDGANKSNPYTLTNIQANHRVEVEFEAIPVTTHTITATAGANGSISPSGRVSVNDGASQNFTIVADTGYRIKDVKVDGASVGTVSSYQFDNVTADHTISAEFEVIPPTSKVIHATAGANGSIAPGGDVSVNIGANQTFTITADTGYEIEDVDVDGASQGAISTYTFTNVQEDHTIEATFKEIPVVVETYTVVVTDNTSSGLSGYGTISPAAGTHTVNVGTATTVTATPATGYKIKTLTLDGADKTSPFTINGVKDQTYNVIVEFEQIPTGNIYSKAYTQANGRRWQEPTAATIVLGDPDADTATSIAQIVAGTYSWTSKAQAKSIETFVIAKSVGRITSIKNAIDIEVLNNSFEERSVTIDGVDYWVYNNKSTVGAGNATYTIKGTEA